MCEWSPGTGAGRGKGESNRSALCRDAGEEEPDRVACKGLFMWSVSLGYIFKFLFVVTTVLMNRFMGIKIQLMNK